MEKLKFIFISLYLSLYGAPEVDVSIEHALTTVHGNQTVVVIGYSGADTISYVKSLNDEGVLTIDFPSVFSNVDFEELEIPQVENVQQLTLNPDANQGISIRFQLKQEATFSVYESEARELTFIFEGAVETPDLIVGKGISNTDQHLDVLSENVSNRLTEVNLHTSANGGIILTNCSAASFSTFRLQEPERIVIDFKDVVLATSQNDFSVDLEMVEQIRVRQFRTEPVPVTRMVLDLNDNAVFEVLRTGRGLAIAFSRDSEKLNQLIEDVLELPVAHVETTEALDTNVLADSELAETIDQSEPTVASLSFEQIAKADAFGTLKDGNRETEKQWDLQTYVQNARLSEQSVESLQPNADFFEQDTDVSANEESYGGFVVTERPETHEATLDVTERVAEVTNRQLVLGDREQVTITEEIQEDPILVSEESTPVVTVATEADYREATIAEETESFSPEDLDQVIRGEVVEDSPETFVAVHKESLDPAFEMAKDIDLELDAFLDESEDQPLYRVMKDVPRNKKRLVAPLVITNESMAKYAGRQLVEAAATQGAGQEDFESLFNEERGLDNYETIDGGQQQYNGFEISSINVRSVSVIDLLRFIADLVGINLYVDSSVSEDLRATYKFTNLPWDQVLDIILKNAGLEKEFTNGVLRVATVEKFQQEAQARADLRMQRELSVPPQTVTFPLSYAKVSEAKPIIESYLSPRGRILIDERTNTLIIEDIPKRMVAIRELIRKLDRIIDQVTIEARIVETNKRFLRELGIQWGLGAQYSPEMGTDTGVTFPNRVNVGGPARGSQIATGPIDGGYAVNFPIVSENPSGLGLTLGNFLDNFKLDISLQMLETDGNGQIISSPKITTQNNKTAIIKNGSRIPVQTVQRGTITIVYIDAVLELEVTPHITSEETIIMDLVIDKSEPDFTRTVSGNPVINVRRAETRVLVKNGGTAVIGGIFSLNEQAASQGLPGVRKVPVLKRLFGSESKSYSNEELLIFITPRIVKY